MNRKSKVMLIINIVIFIIAISAQIYLILANSNNIPYNIIIGSIGIIACFFIIIYSVFNIKKINDISNNFEKLKLDNKTLTTLHDSVRGFKHDFNNIIQSFGGYIETNNIKGLKKYYSQLLKDCNRVNNLSSLSPNIINNPAIYNLLVSKYHTADEDGIELNINVSMNLNEIENQMKIYEFTRILGILMDNAIEAASECKEKIININFQNEQKRNRLVMIIENTYKNKKIDLDRIFEKNFSTKSKSKNSGLGLWEVKQFLKKNNNLNLFTTKNGNFFSQQLEIYY